MVRKLIKLIDASCANEIHSGDNFFVDDMHDAVYDEKSDESNEEECQGQFPGEWHSLPDIGAELVGHLVNLVHFECLQL